MGEERMGDLQGPPGNELAHAASVLPAGDSERTPTLMASAGVHGDVRTWTPSRKSLRASLLGSGLATLAYICLVIDSLMRSEWPSLVGNGMWMFAVAVWFLLSLNSYLHPCCVAADDAGIAVATPRGNRAFFWCDIEDLTPRNCVRDPLFLTMKVRAANVDGKSGSVILDLHGYSSDDRQRIRELILQHIDSPPPLNEARGQRTLTACSVSELPDPDRKDPN